MNKIVIVKEKSENSKTGPVSVTYAPIKTCPKTCPFLDKGCYAQLGHSGIHLARLNRNVNKRLSANKIAEVEAENIDKLKANKPLRLHIVGDCNIPQSATILSCAAERYSEKDNQPVWTYTHSWRTIPRENWGDISVLASCETLEDVKYAMKRDYAACIVRLKPFKGTIPWQGLKLVACKEITNKIQCEKCKLCFNDKKLLAEKRVICFFPHGSRQETIRQEILKKEGLT